MPILIRELHIRTIVGAEKQRENQRSAPRQMPAQPEQQLVKACVDEVLRILQEKQER